MRSEQKAPVNEEPSSSAGDFSHRRRLSGKYAPFDSLRFPAAGAEAPATLVSQNPHRFLPLLVSLNFDFVLLKEKEKKNPNPRNAAFGSVSAACERRFGAGRI